MNPPSSTAGSPSPDAAGAGFDAGDAGEFLPADNAMITGALRVGAAVGVARHALERGRLVHVCAHCIPRAMRDALARFTNASHGICAPCLREQLDELEAAR